MSVHAFVPSVLVRLACHVIIEVIQTHAVYPYHVVACFVFTVTCGLCIPSSSDSGSVTRLHSCVSRRHHQGSRKPWLRCWHSSTMMRAMSSLLISQSCRVPNIIHHRGRPCVARRVVRSRQHGAFVAAVPCCGRNLMQMSRYPRQLLWLCVRCDNTVKVFVMLVCVCV
jgi:hypothetical protein